MKTLRADWLLSIFVAVTGASPPASAELYKWVDARGVTNYSNNPPAAAAAANKLARVESTLSVYTPDASLLEAVKALRQRASEKLTEPEPQRSPVARIASAPAGYEQCIDSGRPGCGDLYPVYYPAYLPVAVYGRRGVQPPRFLTPPRANAIDRSRVSRGPRR